MVRCIHLPAPQCRPGLLMPWDWFLAREENMRGFLVLTEGCLRIKIHFCLCDGLSGFLNPQDFLVRDCLPVLWLCVMLFFRNVHISTSLIRHSTNVCWNNNLPQLTFPFSFLTLLLMNLIVQSNWTLFHFLCSHLHALVVCSLLSALEILSSL